MGSLISPELNLDSPEKWVSGAGTCSSSETQNFSNLQDYVAGLQDEMKKIEAFERELPLCMLLVKDEIARLRKEPEKSNCIPIPSFEEFLPLKREQDEKIVQVAENENRDKLNWMSSVQLWNYGDHQIHESNNKKGINNGVQGKEEKGKNEDEIPLLSLCIPETNKIEQETDSSGLSPKSSSVTSSATDANLNSNPRISRKVRRCWSSELRRRFIDALQQLGGPRAATPKQIRELMKIDDLTNDEVKSHLQKYRLHVRRGPTLSNNQYHKSIKRTKPQSLLPLVG